MKYTNKNELPDYVVGWLKNDEYDYESDTISATKLIAPPRQYALYKLHADDLEIDVSDLIASRYGTAIHAAFEQIEFENIEQEKRMYCEIEVDGKVFKLSGKFDMLKLLPDGTHKLIDIKSTSVWSYIYGSKTEDYIKQLSIYKFLGNKNGYNIGSDADICMIFTDWNKTKAATSLDYPPLRIAIKPIVLWDDQKTEDFIKERLRLFIAAEKELPECTPKELWENRGKVKRCEYCMARKFCKQFEQLLAQGKVDGRYV